MIDLITIGASIIVIVVVVIVAVIVYTEISFARQAYVERYSHHDKHSPLVRNLSRTISPNVSFSFTMLIAI